MTVSFVGAASAEATSLTLPAHQAGDLIVMFAYRDANGIATTPTGWYMRRGQTTGGIFGLVVAYKIADTSSEVSGTWTNASALMAAVYRSDSHSLTIGGWNALGNATLSSTLSYPAMSAKNTGNSDAKLWSDSAPLLLAAFTRQNSTTMEQAPASATMRHNGVLTTFECVLHDTAAVASRTSSSITTDANMQYLATAVEVIELTPKTASAGMLIHPGMSGGMRG